MIEKIPNNLLKIIKNGENSTVEFKKANNKLPNNLFETICAMLNRNGGHIFLGVSDDKKILGVDSISVDIMRRDFANLCNNSQKIYPTVHLELKPYSYMNKIILYINVYESSDVHNTVGKIYDRNEDGDYDITGSRYQVSEAYIRKSKTYVENKIYPYIKMDDLDEELINRARIMAVNKNSTHPWKNMNNLEILKSVGLYDKDFDRNIEGFNLACVLLFGKDYLIRSIIPYYKTDALLRKENIDRYDDRLTVTTNLIDSYDRLIEFISKHTNDKFYLEDGIRISARNIIAREIVANMLMHREFSNPITSRIIITKDSISTENPNIPKNIGYINLKDYIPYTKNPKIASVFKEIGLADELGSGIKNVTKYTKIYSNKEPVFSDNDIFKVIVPMNDTNTPQEPPKNPLSHPLRTSQENNTKKDIINLIKNNNKITQNEISEILSKPLRTIKRQIEQMQVDEIIERDGSKKNGVWKVNEDKVKIYSVNGTLNGTLNDTKKDIINLIKNNNKITQNEISEILNKPLRTIKRQIEQMKVDEIIERDGSKKNGVWKVNKDNTKF